MSASEDQLEPVHLPSPTVCVTRWRWRLVLAATLIGALSALAAALVRLGFRGLQWILTGSSVDPPLAAQHLALWRRALTPVVGALLATVVLWLRRQRAHRLGREPRPYVEYVEAVRHRHGCIPLLPNSWRTLSAAFSVASGAAVGREGSMIQFAAAVASVTGGWLQWLNEDSPTTLSFLVACGVAGGVTTAYNAPIAAVFFAAEIVLGGLQVLELPLLGMAAGAGWLVSGLLLGRERLYPAHATLVAQPWALCSLVLFAALCGVAGPLYQWMLQSVRSARRLPLALLWSGALVGCLSLLDPRVWGNGDMALRGALGGAAPALVPAGGYGVLRVLLLRLAATSACVWTGTVGGVFTPTLFVGGALGALLGHLAPASQPALWAMAGMSCLMAAVTHAPLMAAFMTAELTGDWALLPVLLPLNVISWQIARRISSRAMYAIASQSPGRTSPKPENVAKVQ